MIKINADRKVNLKELEKKHLDYMKAYHLPKLQSITGIKRIRNKGIYLYLLNHFDELVTGEPDVLRKIIIDIQKMGVVFDSKSSKKTKLYKDLLEVFKYNDFVTRYPNPASATPVWGAYTFVAELGVTVCPYCNRQYIFTLCDSHTGKTRGSIDHFYKKSTYPYLALSFYNLIPSCKLCNSDLKGNKEFSLDTHVHPFLEEFGEAYTFSLKMRPGFTLFNRKGECQIDFLLGSGDEFDIELKSNTPDNKFEDRLKNSADIFKLKELYNMHKDYVVELIKKSVMYPDSRIDELLHQYQGKLFTSRVDVIQTLLSNYVQSAHLDKRILAKLSRDISRELGIVN
ncbi:hypothetical protein KP806_18385 [Paenibacillus sp. N4]|uniref:hypothetical protein n=1 Tax=Paenibacillus vietnamensis TaxID=2590547 RepID=UPI001CD13D66|nr:hypothetical protein [Paenibacillus vietnamensis]MCA0757033.1 hypothetical protein [Paenibacillus vietnamensis]